MLDYIIGRLPSIYYRLWSDADMEIIAQNSQKFVGYLRESSWWEGPWRSGGCGGDGEHCLSDFILFGDAPNVSLLPSEIFVHTWYWYMQWNCWSYHTEIFVINIEALLMAHKMGSSPRLCNPSNMAQLLICVSCSLFILLAFPWLAWYSAVLSYERSVQLPNIWRGEIVSGLYEELAGCSRVAHKMSLTNINQS